MTDASTLSYAVQGAQMATSAKAQIDAADTGDASLSVRGCASCCADWSKHFCSFFSECLTRPQNLVTLFDREHLTNTGHGLHVPIQAWICVQFYLGLAYDVLSAVGAVFSLELATFLPAFIVAVLYTTVGSYSWYWACIAGNNLGCCLLWIKGLVFIEMVHIILQVIDMYDSECTMSASDLEEVADSGDADCSVGAVVKFFKFIALLVTIVPSVALFYFGIQCYYTRLKYGHLPKEGETPQLIVRTAPTPAPAPAPHPGPPPGPPPPGPPPAAGPPLPQVLARP